MAARPEPDQAVAVRLMTSLAQDIANLQEQMLPQIIKILGELKS